MQAADGNNVGGLLLYGRAVTAVFRFNCGCLYGRVNERMDDKGGDRMIKLFIIVASAALGIYYAVKYRLWKRL